jgi:UDP-glucose 4-epimerase
MRVLITGGAGFIGSHLAEHWSAFAGVAVLDNLRTGSLSNLEGIPHDFFEGDIQDLEVVEAAMKDVEVVFHLAAMVSVPESVERPADCIRDNVLGTLNVLEAASRRNARVIFASSAAVYGDNPTVPKVESMLPEPKSPYAVTKLDGEFYLDCFRQEHGLSAAGLRFFNVFGPRQNPQGPYASAVPVFITRALQNQPLTIFGDGSQTRDFIYVKDIVSALSFLARRGDVSGIYNAGYGAGNRIDELAGSILARTGSAGNVEYGPERAGDVKHSYACADRLLGLGWKPSWNFEDALAETISWYARQI